MTVKLGNIVLDDNLRLYGIEEAGDILIAEMEAFDGTNDFLTMPASEWIPLSLVANPDGDTVRGLFTLDQIIAIKSIIAAGQQTGLVHHRGIFEVMVRSVSNFVQVIDYADPAGNDWCTATINMKGRYNHA